MTTQSKTKTRGEWIDPTPNGRWKARYRTPDGKVKSKTWNRKGDARRWLREEEHKIDSLTWIDSRAGEVRFSEVAASFMASRVDVRQSTRTRDRSYLNSSIPPKFWGSVCRSDSTLECSALGVGALRGRKGTRDRT